MWFLGHTALAFLYALPLLLPLDGKRVVRTVAVVPFFANLVDFLHTEALRPYSHNLVGALVLPLVALLVWRAAVRWSWYELLVLGVASTSGIVGDLAFGAFHLYAPLDWRPVGFRVFGGAENQFIEAVLGPGVLFAFLVQFRGLSGPSAVAPTRAHGLLPLPFLAVLATSVLFWGEVYAFVSLNGEGLTTLSATALMFLQMVAVSLLMTGFWVAALLATRTEGVSGGTRPLNPPPTAKRTR